MRLLPVLWCCLPLAATGFSSFSSFTVHNGGVGVLIYSSTSSSSQRRHNALRRLSLLRRRRPSSSLAASSASSSWLTMYESSHDPPSSPAFNAWTVLAKTEQWISDTLASTNAHFNNKQPPPPPQTSPQSSSSTPTNSNPYTRKEVEYACENASDSPMITASLFRRLKEVREMGEHHGRTQDLLLKQHGPSYELKTFRKTQVVVIPGNTVLAQNFSVFDRWMETINQARRNARDYVTDVALEKLGNKLFDDDDYEDDDEDRDWSVSVNCAHLHPKFGELTPWQQLQQLQQEEQNGGDGEVDINYQEYQERKMMARRSPYPTLVLEVRAVPPPDFGQAPPPPPLSRSSSTSSSSSSSGAGSVSSADIQRLEALFGKSAALNHPSRESSLSSSTKSSDDDFYNAIGNTIQEISSVTPLRLAQEWMAQNDPNIASTAVFTESNTRHVDAAYEYIFTNVAMMREAGYQRQYLVLPHFLSSSATSFEKLSQEVTKLFHVLPDLQQWGISIHTFHPEHVDPTKRSPVPVYVLEVPNNNKNNNKQA